MITTLRTFECPGNFLRDFYYLVQNFSAVNKEDLYRLIDQITDPVELETAYRAIDSIVKHDDQSWYWTERWQEGELEADTDKQQGRVSRGFSKAKELFDHLDSVTSQERTNDEN